MERGRTRIVEVGHNGQIHMGFEARDEYMKLYSIGDLAETKQFYRPHVEVDKDGRMFVPGTRGVKTDQEFFQAIATFNGKIHDILEKKQREEKEKPRQPGDPGYGEWRAAQRGRERSEGERER